jgi:hypothetical protein
VNNDLFNQDDELAAERAAAEAKAERLRAVYRAGVAGAGHIRRARQAVEAATLRALRAEAELARVRQARNKH